MNRHMTWEKPDKAELRQLNLAMLFKAVRLLLSSLAICAYVQFVIWLSHSGLDINFTIIASLLIVIYYYFWRHALVFGRREALEDDVKEKTLFIFLWTFANAILLIPVFLFFAEKMGIASIVLTALMSVLTFWREWFMLILFILKKYTVKDGEVCYHRKNRKIYSAGAPGTRRGVWVSVVYVLDFEDAGERIIPVMVDLYTYSLLKKHGDALLINYKYGESYLFELVKAKKNGFVEEKNSHLIIYGIDIQLPNYLIEDSISNTQAVYHVKNDDDTLFLFFNTDEQVKDEMEKFDSYILTDSRDSSSSDFVEKEIHILGKKNGKLYSVCISKLEVKSQTIYSFLISPDNCKTDYFSDYRAILSGIYVPQDTEIRIDFDLKDYRGKNIEDVVADLKNKGFRNIKTENLKDVVLGVFARDGVVETVTINGNSDFKAGAWIDSQDGIRVTYHGKSH